MMIRPPRFTLLPLLQIQRDLLDQDPGPDRFRTYLWHLLGDQDEMKLPIQSFNPMSKDHVKATLDELLKMSAEDLLDDILEGVRDDQGQGHALLKTGLVVADDVKGGWTNRATIEIDRWTTFEKIIWHGFAPLLWWASDPMTPAEVDFRLRRQIYEVLRVIDGRRPRCLEDILELRSESSAFAGRELVGTDDWNRLLERLRPYLTARDTPTLVACLFGDDAAVALGYAPLGIKSSEAPGLR